MKLLPKILIFVTLSLLSLTAVKAQDPEPFRGIWCDTQQQIERVVTEGTRLGGAAFGIEAVNEQDGEKSCIHAVILGVRQSTHNTIDSPEGMLDVVSWKIVAIPTPFGLIEVEDKVWFTLEGSKARGA